MSTGQKPDCFKNEAELNKLDKHSKQIVFGYTRQQQNDNLFKIFPKLITVTILAFYTDNIDEFNPDLCSKNFIISDNNINELQINKEIYPVVVMVQK